MRSFILTLLSIVFLSAAALPSVAKEAPPVDVVPDATEFAVLKKLYDSLGGASWTSKTNWPAAGSWPASATSAQFGTWQGITVANGDITAIVLNTNNLVGKLPSGIGTLTALTSLQLQSNGLTGPIPTDLGALSPLKVLYLHNNHLTGSIPASLGNLTGLTHLYLHLNDLTGPIPSELGGLSSLLYLKLNDNQLTGKIPSSLGNLSSVLQLYLNTNALTDSIPSSLGQLSHLTYLYLHDNALSGKIPAQLGNLPALTILYLMDNQLTGSIPASLGNLSNLTHLFLNTNALSGELPASLGSLSNLKYFSVAYNSLSGSIPSSYANFTKLIQWSSNNNAFTGTLPTGLFAGKTTLSNINVSYNAFEGVFSDIAGCTALATVTANNNQLTSLSTGVLNAPAMTVLNFGTNELTTIPGFSAHVNKAALTLTLINNRLDFSALEQTKNSGVKTTSLVPQKNFKDVAIINPTENALLVIPGRAAGASGTITWEKLGADGVTWVNVNVSNEDATRQTYKRSAYHRATDEGMYRFSMTNTVFSTTVLRSEPIQVKEQLTAVLDDWAFQYRYDARRRMTHKKVPGADWVYMVYDERDRLVLTQDGEQRKSKQWLFTKYDALNRPVMTGIYTHDATIDQETMAGLISTTNFYETFGTGGSPLYHGYSNTVFPTSNLQLLTVTYYDNYNFKTGWGQRYDYLADQVDDQAVNGVTYEQPATPFGSVIGQVTGTKVRTLESEPAWLQTVTYYDDRYRPVQVISDNYKKGTDRVTNVYDFVGKVLATKTDHVLGTITWQNAVNVAITEDKVTKSVVSSAWNTAGASSVEQIPANTDGWIEATMTDLSRRFFGLSDQDVDQNYTTIDYAFYLSTSTLIVYVNGASKYTDPDPLVPGDRLRIERKGGAVSFYKNGIKVYTSTVTSTSALMADLAFYAQGSTISRLTLSAAQGAQQLVERTLVYDHAGRLKEAWHALNNSNNKILLVKNEYNALGQLVDKKLHSTVSSATDAKQSVDYRYNIRGWLTSINNAALADDATNDDTNDLFGMNLGYNTNLGFTATPQLQFNGNISAITYSKDLGKGDIKQTGYGFTYDPMNRLLGASNKQLSAPNTWSAGGFDESGITYDQNGNILTLQRKGKSGVLIDDLKYTYSAPEITASNKLLYVLDQTTDPKNKAKGFVDGNASSTQDYTYDYNGNMTHDLNKGIGTSTTDAANVIAYNHLNLPQTVTKGGSTIQYIYDATGRKLAQYVTMGASQKRTDYAGEFIYEDHVLQFINHEEGRIVVSVAKPVYTNGFDTTSNITAINTTLAKYAGNGEKYTTATANNVAAGNGVFPIGEAIAVNGGERYKIRLRGYAGTSAAYLQVKIGGVLQSATSALLPNSAVTETWVEQVVTIPGTAPATLEAGVLWNTVTTGEKLYLNELEVIKLETTAPEYQYHLKDHLGNVRLTFTTKDEVDTNKATLEPAAEDDERSQFVRYDDVRLVRSAVFDHTNNNNPTSQDGHAVVLRGGDKETTGLVKTLSVMPGDVINMKVYAKYMGGTRNEWPQALTNLAAAVAAGTTGTAVDGSGYSTKGFIPFEYLGDNGTGDSEGTGPKAYLNYIMFDRDFNPILGDITQTFYKRVSTAALENGNTLIENANGVSHELLEATVTVKQAGYLYIYLSNEETSPVEVFFDDFEVSHTKSPVIQSDEYYPFGLAFNGYQSENLLMNQYQYNGKEIQDELGLGTFDYGFRMYDPAMGRWWKIDPLAEIMLDQSPYSYAFNNPVKFVDLFGLAPGDSNNDLDPLEARAQANQRWVDMGGTPYIATCPTCPADSKYDDYRNSSSKYEYSEGVVYDDIGGEVGVTASREDGAEAQQGAANGNLILSFIDNSQSEAFNEFTWTNTRVNIIMQAYAEVLKYPGEIKNLIIFSHATSSTNTLHLGNDKLSLDDFINKTRNAANFQNILNMVGENGNVVIIGCGAGGPLGFAMDSGGINLYMNGDQSHGGLFYNSNNQLAPYFHMNGPLNRPSVNGWLNFSTGQGFSNMIIYSNGGIAPQK